MFSTHFMRRLFVLIAIPPLTLFGIVTGLTDLLIMVIWLDYKLLKRNWPKKDPQ